MRQLKDYLNQPEAWLREVLEKVAELNKTGRFANKWSLKAGNRTLVAESAPVAEAAPDTGEGGDDDDDEGDDTDIKMEDVMPS
jgi:transcription initiation factor TFIIF subunit beta